MVMYTWWPGRDETEQEGTGLAQAAAAMGSMQVATATREATGTHAIIFVIVFLLCLFFISLFFFSDYFFLTSTTTGATRKERAGRAGWDIRRR